MGEDWEMDLHLYLGLMGADWEMDLHDIRQALARLNGSSRHKPRRGTYTLDRDGSSLLTVADRGEGPTRWTETVARF